MKSSNILTKENKLETSKLAVIAPMNALMVNTKLDHPCRI